MKGKDVSFIISGSTVGAIAVGDGAKVNGRVTVGGAPRTAGKRLRMTIDVRGAESRDQISEWLRQVRKDILDDGEAGAIGDVDGSTPSGCAWRIEEEPQ